jgi:hypothetical protein
MTGKAVLSVVALALATVFATPAQAQRNEFTLEASPIRGALAFARHQSPTTLLGIELGIGVPQFDITIQPPHDSETGSPNFEELLNLAAFVRFKPSRNFEVDTGLRGSIAGLWTCTVGDCWPALYGGAYVQPMAGWQRFKVGTRLTAGWIGEVEEGTTGSNTFLVGLSPFILRLTLSR